MKNDTDHEAEGGRSRHPFTRIWATPRRSIQLNFYVAKVYILLFFHSNNLNYYVAGGIGAARPPVQVLFGMAESAKLHIFISNCKSLINIHKNHYYICR